MANKVITFTSSEPCDCCGGCILPGFNIPIGGTTLYADETAAQAALDNFVYDCLAYVIPPGEGGTPVDSFSVSGGSSSVVSLSAHRDMGYDLAVLVYLGADLVSGDTLSVAFAITQPDGDEDPSENIRVRIYDTEWSVLSTQYSSLLSGTITYSVPATGAYIFEIKVSGKTKYDRDADTHVSATLTLSSNGSFSSNTVVAQYANETDCPSKLACE